VHHPFLWIIFAPGAKAQATKLKVPPTLFKNPVASQMR
jgi:hypothetical protein